MTPSLTADRYAARSFVRVPAGINWEFLVLPSGEVEGPLHAHTVAMLEQCRAFKTLHQHGSGICETLGLPSLYTQQHDPIAPILSELRDAGLFVSSGDLLRQVVDSCRGELPPPIQTVGLVTCNRPRLLARALQSYIANTRNSGRTLEFVIMDDSDDRAGYESRQVAQEAASCGGNKILYAGLQEKEEYARILTAHSKLNPAVIRFALFGAEGCRCTIGANRNALALDTAGRLVLTADDDSICRLVTHPNLQARSGQERPGLQQKIRLSSDRHPCEWWFRSDCASAGRDFVPVEEDVLALHERFLGHSVGSLIGQRDVEHDIEIRGESIIGQLLKSSAMRSAQVRLTVPGVLGDSGMYSSWSLLMCGEESFDRLTASQPRFHSATTSRQVLRVSDCASLEAMGFCMATTWGIDNRDLLPPFMPVQRNEDGSFAAALAKYSPADYCAHLPWAVMHDPDARSDSLPYLSALDGIRFSDVLLQCIASQPDIPWARGAERLTTLGTHLKELGSMPSAEFEALLHLWLCQDAANKITRLETRLKEQIDPPEYWATDVRAAIARIRATVGRPDYIVPTDLLGGRRPEAARKMAQRLVRQYGELLCAWPAIVAVARELSNSGVRVAQPVTPRFAMAVGSGNGAIEIRQDGEGSTAQASLLRQQEQ